jgi:hypothetical protein
VHTLCVSTYVRALVALRMHDCVCVLQGYPCPSTELTCVTPPGGGKSEAGEELRPECRRNATGKQLGHYGQRATRLASTRPTADSSARLEAIGRGMGGRIAAPTGTGNSRTSRGMGMWAGSG